MNPLGRPLHKQQHLLLLLLLLAFGAPIATPAVAPAAAPATGIGDPATATDISLHGLSATSWADSDLAEGTQGTILDSEVGEEHQGGKSTEQASQYRSMWSPSHLLEEPVLNSSNNNTQVQAHGAPVEASLRTRHVTRLVVLLAVLGLGAAMFFRGASVGKQGSVEEEAHPPTGGLKGPIKEAPTAAAVLTKAHLIAKHYDIDSLHSMMEATERLERFLGGSSTLRDVLMLQRRASAIMSNVHFLVGIDPQMLKQQLQDRPPQPEDVARLLQLDSDAQLSQLTRAIEGSVSQVAGNKHMEVIRTETFVTSAYEASLAVSKEDGSREKNVELQLLHCSAVAVHYSTELQQARDDLAKLKNHRVETLAEMAAMLQACAAAAERVQTAVERARDCSAKGTELLASLTNPEEALLLELQDEIDNIRLYESAAERVKYQLKQEEQQKLEDELSKARECIDFAIEELEALEELKDAVQNPFTPGPIKYSLIELHVRSKTLHRMLGIFTDRFAPFVEAMLAKVPEEQTQHLLQDLQQQELQDQQQELQQHQQELQEQPHELQQQQQELQQQQDLEQQPQHVEQQPHDLQQQQQQEQQQQPHDLQQQQQQQELQQQPHDLHQQPHDLEEQPHDQPLQLHELQL